MKTNKILILFITLAINSLVNAQELGQKYLSNPKNWTVFNREASFNNESIHLNANSQDGLLWLNGSDFKNGTIEFDIKGKNILQQSFVGLAFHGLNDSTFDAVYFRPFNFKNSERNSHSVQYISMPEYDWQVLRNAFPGKYENTIDPVPDPVDDWFHAKIVLNFPTIKVFVNNSDKASLEVDQISARKNGKIAFWVGNGSEGWFKNLKISDTK